MPLYHVMNKGGGVIVVVVVVKTGSSSTLFPWYCGGLDFFPLGAECLINYTRH